MYVGRFEAIPPNFQRNSLSLWNRAVPIGGIIENEHGQPIPGATVAIARFTKGSHDEVVHGVLQRIESLIATQVVTDARGHWQINSVPADASSLMFRLSHPDYVSDAMFNATHPPSTEALHDMTGVMVMQRGAIVDGIVLDDNGRAIQGAKVTLGDDCNGTDLPTRQTDASGSFVFSHTALGQVTLTFQATGYAPELKIIDTASDTNQLEVRLARGNTIRGRVVDSNGKPIEGVSVSTDWWRGKRTLDWKSRTDAAGRFVWGNAPRDEVRFWFWKAGLQSPNPQNFRS